jgi:carbamoyl-phosphate synthase large subunit
MSLSPIHVFIPSGAGAPGFAGIAACLREDPRIRLISGDMVEFPYGRSLSDAFYQMPSPLDETRYLERLEYINNIENIDVILPITTRELNVLANHQNLFLSLGINVVISKPLGLEIANDKGRLHEYARNIKIPVPEGGVVSNATQFQTLARELFEKHQELFFKPTTGNGSRGIGRVTQKILSSFKWNKPNLIPLLLDEWLPRLGEDFTTPLLLSEYLPGTEYSVDTFFWEGMDPIIVPRTRDKIVSGISVSGTFENHEKIITETRRLVSHLSLKGPIGVQWKLDSKGNPKLLEINPRLQGTTSALRQISLNIPRMSIYAALGLPIEKPSTWSWGSSFTRHWNDVFL